MAELRDEISAYEQMRADLEASSLGKWVLVHDGQLIGTYDTFDAAANEAVERFGFGPYLIRQIGAPPIALPASVLYQPTHGESIVRPLPLLSGRARGRGVVSAPAQCGLAD
jgi:hypothetical protein